MFRSPIAAGFTLAKKRNAAACDSECRGNAASSPLGFRNAGARCLCVSTEKGLDRKPGVFALMSPLLAADSAAWA
jgi:hypothetical protein